MRHKRNLVLDIGNPLCMLGDVANTSMLTTQDDKNLNATARAIRQLRDELVAARAIEPKTAHALEAGAIALGIIANGGGTDELRSKARHAAA